MVPAQRPRAARAVILATLLVCVAFASLGAFAASAGAVDQAGFCAAQAAAATARAGDTGAKTAEPAVDLSGPTVALTVPALASSASKNASFKVSWSASPTLPSGGYDAFRVEYREPGVDYWLVWLAATTATSATFPGEPGHAYIFRVAAARSGDATTVGPWSTEKPATVPADEAAFTYTKTWARTSVSTAYFGKIRSCATKGATATYRLKGTKAALIAPRGRALGKVAVYVRSATADGWTAYKLVKTIDLYSKTAKARVATTFGAWDPAVERQVKLVVTGKKNLRSTSTKVSLDGLAVYGAPRATTWHAVTIQPSTPSVVITDQLQFSVSIDGCVDQRVTWTVERYDRFGIAHTDGAGTITSAGLYTAPGLPTTTSGDDQRGYYVTARAVANPDKVVGMREITVAPWPSPFIDSGKSPASAAAGSTVTLYGGYFTHPDPEVRPRAFFSTRELEVTGYTDTTLSARIPSDWPSQWDPTMTANVYVVTADPAPTSWHMFTITGIKPSPPSPWTNGLNAASYDDDNASVGDELRIYGHGFAPAASDNIVRFGGVQVAASRYEPDPYGDDLGAVYVTVPEGAQTGPLGFQRLDGDGRWNLDGPVLEVKPATVVTAGLHPSFNGYVTGPRSARNASWGTEDWVLSGSDFLKLRNANYSTTTTGVFWLDMRRNGVTYSRIMRAVSDTLAVPHGYWGPSEMMPDEIFGDAQGGDTVEIRIRGDELTNRYERMSPWVPVTVGERPVWGAVHDLPVSQLAGWWSPGHQLAQGDWLKLRTGGGPATQMLTCPGLWPGQLPLGTDGASGKLVRLSTKGSYTLTNLTTGASTTFTVGDLGSLRTVSYGGFQFTDVQADGLLMRNGGASVEIPPGALSADDLAASEGYFIVALDHAGSERVAFDTTLTDGGRNFSFWISPQPTKLLKPVTVTIPYELAGRATTPFLGMWDASSGLYYDYRLPSGQIDTTNHRMTIVLPAGDYSGTGGVVGAAAKSSTGRVLAKSFFPVSSFNLVLKAVGAVSSKVATSDEGFVWHPADHPTWGIRVDAVTDPSSSSYVPPEKAQEVLDVAADVWTNLDGKGWREPEAMISITVRDYGDPGNYQGATTKGVFGQPWVYVNSRLTMGKKLDTAVAHEMGHVFQRQLTTNIGTVWIDEATAEWIAWDTLGTGSDLQVQFEYGCDFPAVAFPSGFSWDYSPEQAYAAGAFIIWMADTYGPASVLDIYDTLAFRPSYWYDAPATFREATGKTVPQLVAEFAPEFWLQSYEPVNAFTFWSRLPGAFSDFSGEMLSLDMGADSSRGASIAPIPAFRPSLLDETMVARATGLPIGATVNVYRDMALSSATPAAPVLVGTLSSLTPVLDLGLFDASVGCYRLVAVTPPGAAMSAAVTVEPVHVMTRTPQSGAKAGGYTVTLDGFGFGDQPGFVMMGPAMVNGSAITSWTDTRIVFTMPNMGTTTGAQVVQVQPQIGGISNGVTFTVF